MSRAPTALVAEDEPLLAAEIRKLLRQAWPELQIVAEATDGVAATAMALDTTPDVLFLDIKMPGRTGLAVAEAVIDEWPDGRPAPLVVFITAYDEYALAAFEHQAVDYVLKPATAERIERTVGRLRDRLAERTVRPADGDLARLLQDIQKLVPSSSPSSEGRLDAIHVGVGSNVRVVQATDVLYFEATDKYVAVHTREGEGLIRMSMRDLTARLDPALFIQVHRGAVVNRSQIVMATRDESGRMMLKLRDSPRGVGVSRAFAHHFRRDVTSSGSYISSNRSTKPTASGRATKTDRFDRGIIRSRHRDAPPDRVARRPGPPRRIVDTARSRIARLVAVPS